MASLTTSLTHPRDDYLIVHIEERRVVSPLAITIEEDVLVCNTNLQECDAQGTDDKSNSGEEDWFEPLIQHLMDKREPIDPIKHAKMRQHAPRFTLQGNQLYRRSLDGILLRCLLANEASNVINEMHAGVFGGHQSGPKLQYQLRRLSYYWPTMVVDCTEYAKRCHVYQLRRNYGHIPVKPLHITSYSWPFFKWGMDIVGHITPTSAKGYRYILATIDYFSKWVKIVVL